MLKQIKFFLQENKIDFLLLPNNDEFFSEYLPESKRRIKAITGFNGSNAVVIFGVKKSYFFTDSRYILQAKNQLDLAEYEIFDIANKPIITWLESNLTEKKLALFTKITSVDFVNEVEKFASKNLQFFDEIFIDKFLINQNLSPQSPQSLLSKIFHCDEKISGLSDIKKRAIIASKIIGDAMLITKSNELSWLLNIRGFDFEHSPLIFAYAILYKDSRIDLFIDEKRIDGFSLENVNFIPEEQLESRLNFIKKDYSSIDVNFNNLNYFILKILQKNKFNINNQKNIILQFMMQKNPQEIYGAEMTHKLDGLALTRFILWFKKNINTQNITEFSAQNKLHEFRKQNKNFICESFSTISAFAKNGAIIHYHCEEKFDNKIEGNSLYLLDSGGQYLGENFFGTTDVTRTLLVGNPTLEMIANYTLVLKGHIALARVKFPRGITGGNLDILARFHLWQVGLDYQHGTGHGVGSFSCVHEGFCNINLRNNTQLLPNMILSNEPGYYKEGHYGIRLENLQRVVEIDDKFLAFKSLTLVAFEAELIDFKMLTYPEKKWLKNYHQAILDEFLNQLSIDEKEDLIRLCQAFIDL